MAETTLDLRHLSKAEAYAQLDAHVRAVLPGVDDPVTAMATVSCLVHHPFAHLWTGFYRVVDDGRLPRAGGDGAGRGGAGVSGRVHRAVGGLWAGLYRVVDDGRLLRVGPYQGTLGC